MTSLNPSGLALFPILCLISRNTSDLRPINRQRRHFFYLTGCALPDCHLVYHIPTQHLTLFIPPLDPDSVIWSGLPLSTEDAIEKYDIDSCLPSAELHDYLSQKTHEQLSFEDRKEAPQPLTFADKRHLPEEQFAQSVFLPWNLDVLHEAIDECRVTKDTYEVASIRKANEVSTAAHVAVLQNLKHAKNEQELEAVFLERCIALGCKEQAYHGIFGSGVNAATLHYQANNQPLKGRANLLVDAAAEYECYCADVTRTMPLGGTFNTESEQIYTIVQSMQEACLTMLKAGVQWEDVHVIAHEVAIEGLLKLGILKGEKKDIFEARTSVAFFPHGLGHYLGMDTHDTGGHPNYEDSDKMFQYLRVRGRLPEGSVITVEPGVYFCRFIIEPYLKDEKQRGFIDEEVLGRYWNVGGVRIEGMCVVSVEWGWS